MEISAIMNINELVIDRNMKKKADIQKKRRAEESTGNLMMAETVEPRIKAIKQADTGQEKKEEPVKQETLLI